VYLEREADGVAERAVGGSGPIEIQEASHQDELHGSFMTNGGTPPVDAWKPQEITQGDHIAVKEGKIP
jgi:hypothetical protein